MGDGFRGGVSPDPKFSKSCLSESGMEAGPKNQSRMTMGGLSFAAAPAPNPTKVFVCCFQVFQTPPISEKAKTINFLWEHRFC
jgi:hypothetical protein